MLISFKYYNGEKSAFKPITCKSISIDNCGNIMIDDEDRGYIDTAHHNYISIDEKDFCGTVMIIEDENGSN